MHLRYVQGTAWRVQQPTPVKDDTFIAWEGGGGGGGAGGGGGGEGGEMTYFKNRSLIKVAQNIKKWSVVFVRHEL